MNITNRLTTQIMALFLAMATIITLALPITVFAASANGDIKEVCSDPANQNSSFCAGYKEGEDDADEKNPVVRVIISVIGILSYIAGALAVIMVIFGGFKFITSSGDAQKVADGRKTVLYALIGIVVIVISRQLILFILNYFS